MNPTSAPERALFDFVRVAKESGTAQRLDPQALFYCSTCSTSKTKKEKKSQLEAGGGCSLSLSLSLSLSFPVAILAQQVEHVEQVERLLMLLDVFVFGFWNEVEQVDHARCAGSTRIRRATTPPIAGRQKPSEPARAEGVVRGIGSR
ncbi:hypothetical protein IVA94_35730 [Bradyrhizobium sp. 156]|uniref:hypothetical protein n=1 Tax=Bradyrhizobium sp. 156 TaxID=2782630 RepID=UPI001FFAFA31|nr:hypothetical protein [Bradyrhizobium sp. 156]MCK1326123.1 hypothetical protein [Bradyrhizobium sp. 156]